MEDHAQSIEKWLGSARSGSSQALGELLNAFRGYLLVVAQQEMDPALQAKGGASDLVQETLLDGMRHLSGFHGASAEELRAWLRRLLLNNLSDFARRYRSTDKRQIDREVPLAVDSTGSQSTKPPPTSPTPSQEMMRNEQISAILAALDRLPEHYQRALRLRFQEGKSFEEMGQLMGLSANAARKLWARAVKQLQEMSEHVS